VVERARGSLPLVAVVGDVGEGGEPANWSFPLINESGAA